MGLRILLLKHLLLQNWKQPFRLVQFLNRMALTIRLYYWLIGPLRNGGCLLQVIRWIYYIFRRILEMVVHVLLNWLRNGLWYWLLVSLLFLWLTLLRLLLGWLWFWNALNLWVLLILKFSLRYLLIWLGILLKLLLRQLRLSLGDGLFSLNWLFLLVLLGNILSLGLLLGWWLFWLFILQFLSLWLRLTGLLL